MNIKRTLFKNKNFKPYYYLKAIFREFPFFIKAKKSKILSYEKSLDPIVIADRLHYYNKLSTNTPLGTQAIKLADFKIPKRTRVYYFDLHEYARLFDDQLRLELIPGDVETTPKFPAIVKSRPLGEDHSNAVLLNLDKVRHFNFIQDDIPFKIKKNLLIGRASIYQEHRIRFYQMYFNHYLCDLGDASKQNKHSAWFKKPISIHAHLAYKFILTLEGNDVATNLKWVMSSNSVAVMPSPKYETWFMEGRLKADFHYIHIQDDYSDLDEKLNYYIHHPEEAEKIIYQAHQFVAQFKNKQLEDLLAVKVLDKYFQFTDQKYTSG